MDELTYQEVAKNYGADAALNAFNLGVKVERERWALLVSDQLDAGSEYRTGEKCPHDKYGYEECEPCLASRIWRNS